ncbi:hypothetical protein DOM22_19875 [Bdellovibrio sp. ZAP7]|uniref:hypothetical protein n=1 Tax=Bdellovibrio sp. ZAP7 TaxID=2231053 RepID=UPI001158B531|nr:hypothetical protein [Bdellovibrio sp. ZAP7]QDK47263.1 hypothetical protein DOM22_19875 [Bdellovibrio sp. ZAP7]
MKATVILALALSAGPYAHALSDKAIYARCYSQLTGTTVPFSDSLYKEVVAGKQSGVAACKSLLQLADMDASGNLKNTDVRATLIVNNFYQFHRTWFPTANKEQITGYRAEFESNTDKFIDMSEPALFLTRNLFTGDDYRNVLSGTTRLEGKRVNDPAIKTGSLSFLNADGSIVSPGMQMVPLMFMTGKGPIRSINESASSFVLQNYAIPNLGRTAVANGAAMSAGAETSVDFYANQGGGILGSRAFFLLNSGQPQGQIFDGALKLPRKWSKTAMESMLCLTLPSLREADVLQYVDSASVAPFRQSSSCIRCHASMDQASYTTRNLVVSLTVDDIRGNGVPLNTKSIMIGKFKPSIASVAGWSSKTVSDFQKQQPTGVLMFRSNADGQLIKQSVSGIEGLGQAMANTNDFYQCAAKRYFEYFTGINVSLYDRSDPANAVLNKAITTREAADRRFIEDLGQQLRSNQSLQKLIENIISSPYYRSANFSDTGK